MLKETEKTELKKSLAQLREGIISLSAMLNKTNEGVLFIGINDDGKVYNVEIGKKTLADITHEIQNNLKPLPLKVTVEDIKIEEKTIIKVSVEGNDTPYSAYGRYYIRVNDSDIQMNSNQLQVFFSNKELNYSKWENIETEYGIETIDEELLLDCVRTANEKGRLEYVYKNTKDALTKLGLITENDKLNNAGLYLFGNNKPLKIKLANYPTDSRTEFGEIKEFNGNIIECIKEATSYIQNHINYKSTIIGLQREEIPEIPIRALREIIINSFAHCSYQTKGDCNQFTIFKSFIKIYNPGQIIKSIDPMKFASGKVGSKIRNIQIASVLYKYGYIEAFGTGFDRTFTLCSQSNIEYNYMNDEFGFTFIFERPQINQNDRINDIINDRINELDNTILKLIASNKYITTSEVSLSTNKSIATIQRHFESLMKKGFIQRIGSRKSGYWEILNK